MAIKPDAIDVEHLDWLVTSRAENQRAALELLKLFNNYEDEMKSSEFSKKAQKLVAVCFSLWRAAFLADKTGKRHAVVEHAKTFLGKMIQDNAIAYPQDRNSREWTFNYYADNAKEGLNTLAEHWPNVRKVLDRTKTGSDRSTRPQQRWNRYHDAFKVAVGCLKNELDALL